MGSLGGQLAVGKGQPGYPFVRALHSLRLGSAGLEPARTASEIAAGKHKHSSHKARRNLFARRRLRRRENGFSHVRCYPQAADSTSITLCLPPKVGIAQQSTECTRPQNAPPRVHRVSFLSQSGTNQKPATRPAGSPTGGLATTYRERQGPTGSRRRPQGRKRSPFAQWLVRRGQSTLGKLRSVHR